MVRHQRRSTWLVPLAVFAGGVTGLGLLAAEGLGAVRRLVAAGADEALAATAARHLLLSAAAIAALGAAAVWLWARRRLRAAAERALESRLSALQARFSMLQRHGNDIVMLLDESGTIVEANDRASEAYGLPPERLRGMSVAALRAPESGPSPAERLAEIRRRGGLVFETRQLRASGEEFPVEISTRCFEAEGRLYFYSVGRDITERRRIQRRLRESEDRLRAILRDLPVLLVALDREGTVTLGEGQQLLAGLPPAQAVGQSAFVLLAHLPGAEQVLRRALAGETLVQKARVDGRRLDCHFTPLRDAGGHLAGTVCVAADVSERHRLRRALRESEERLRLALDGTQAAAVDWDFEAGLVHVGHYWAERLGLPGGELRGTVDEIVPRLVRPEDQGRVRAAMREHLAGQVETYDAEHQVALTAGDLRWVHLRGRVVARGADGAPRRWVGIATDVTAQRQLEARLQIGERMASLGRLAGGVAHEINNPLSYVVSNLAFAADQLRGRPLAETEEVLQALEDARVGAQRARDIVRDLRTFSQPGEDRTEPVDVRHAVTTALALAAGELKHRGRLLTRFDEVPRVMAAERRLGQVFLNLVVNAAQALDPRRSAQNEVRVEVTRAGDGRVVVEVSDNGCGMSSQVQARLFEPFFTTRPIGAGTGLGLSVCHGIVKALGGEIEVESQEGRGSVFRVLLPALESGPAERGFPLPAAEVAPAPLARA
ncbi:MAG: PAS domain S-box protein [Deltaproteobacteria bacterium]|nr:PAS domain S-box protein [Deltaproteobacteria bacterium]